MSETSRGTGWWLASDGRWYPPELHPTRRYPPVAAQAAPEPPGRRGRRLAVIVGATIVMVSIVAYLSVSIVLGGSALGVLRAGSATATVSWQKTSGCVTTFSGTAAGLSLNGSATGVFPSNPTAGRSGCLPMPPVTPRASQFSLLVGRWKGTLGGTAFSLRVTLSAAVPLKAHRGALTVGQIDGTFGSKSVHATLTTPNQS
jgi:hypothetical protein